ncbi:Sorting nexin-41 [Meyerozyma guilliermondii]
MPLDIEQDNNPSFYGSRSMLADPYGHNKNKKTTTEVHPDLVNSTIGLSNKIVQLINHPKVHVEIVGSESLMSSSVIVYAIELSAGDTNSVVKRRYSEFRSLRDGITRLYPTEVIPPIPGKHSFLTYLINSINNSKELSIIETRKRYFSRFLSDICTHPRLRQCPLVHKFLDPNYEMCWQDAMAEPPISMVPNNLLRANPMNPTDQNGLYSLLPIVNGYDYTGPDHLSNLKKVGDDLAKSTTIISTQIGGDFENSGPDDTISLLTSPGFQQLATMETTFHQSIKVLEDLTKLNTRTVRNVKAVVNNLIELGGNLNNFSLQIHGISDNANELGMLVEKFGSAIDSSFLNFEAFLVSTLIPQWQEPMHQLVQYYQSALHTIKFYKYKVVQYRLVHRARAARMHDLDGLTSNYHSHLKLRDLRSVDIDSPSINQAIRRIELKQKRLRGKKSWYGLFGGRKNGFNSNSGDPVEVFPEQNSETETHDNATPQNSTIVDEATASNTTVVNNSTENIATTDDNFEKTNSANFGVNAYKTRIAQLEKEVEQYNQLIELTTRDLRTLTDHVTANLQAFSLMVEEKWLRIMIGFLQGGQQMFRENIQNWQEFRSLVTA